MLRRDTKVSVKVKYNKTKNKSKIAMTVVVISPLVDFQLQASRVPFGLGQNLLQTHRKHHPNNSKFSPRLSLNLVGVSYEQTPKKSLKKTCQKRPRKSTILFQSGSFGSVAPSRI